MCPPCAATHESALRPINPKPLPTYPEPGPRQEAMSNRWWPFHFEGITMSMQAILMLGVAFGVAVFAQSSSPAAALRGTLRDESGALVADAKVSLIDESKGVVRGSGSDSSGSFLIAPVIPGRYSVRIEKEGFNTERIESLWIEVGEQASLLITLHVGASRTEITVQAPSSTDLNAESNTLGSVVDFRQVQDLPLNGR